MNPLRDWNSDVIIIIIIIIAIAAPYMFLVHAGLFYCFHNPSISGKDQKLF